MKKTHVEADARAGNWEKVFKVGLTHPKNVSEKSKKITGKSKNVSEKPKRITKKYKYVEVDARAGNWCGEKVIKCIKPKNVF